MWPRWGLFTIYVVGISSGVRVWELERYISSPRRDTDLLALTAERWVLEVYRTILGTLQGLAWLLLAFFLVALGAFVLVRVVEIWRGGEPPPAPQAESRRP